MQPPELWKQLCNFAMVNAMAVAFAVITALSLKVVGSLVSFVLGPHDRFARLIQIVSHWLTLFVFIYYDVRHFIDAI